MVSIAIAGAVTMIGAMSFSVFMDGFVLRTVMGAILFAFVPLFVISTVVSLVIGAMSFSVFMDGFVLSAVMRAILFSFVLCFMISAIVRVVTAGIVMGVTVSVGKRDWNSGTKHQSQRKKRRNDFTCEFLCHGIIPPMNQNFVCYMTFNKIREKDERKMKERKNLVNGSGENLGD